MIRFAKFTDAVSITNFVETFYNQTHYVHQGEFDPISVKELTENLIKSGILLIAVEDEKIVGIFGGAIRPLMFNVGVDVLYEVIWYVTPEHQKSGLGVALIKRADSIAQLRGCKAFQMVRLACSPPKLDNVFIQLGFEPTEYCFTKVI